MRTPTFEPTVRSVPRACPACLSRRTVPFFELRGVPTNSCILLASPGEARSCRLSDILLCFCEDCGFVANLAFDPTLTEYSERYEETQSFSETFTSYHRELARDLVERFVLKRKRIIEIGCGKGEFLALLCELGDNDGVGFDPAFREERAPPAGAAARLRFVRDLFSARYAHLEADLYCSKMALEHVPEAAEFLRMLRGAIGDRTDVLVYFQVPEFGRILREGLFCDVPYEHCSYFSAPALANLFSRTGFDVLATRVSYGGQHLAIEARPAREQRSGATPVAEGLGELRSLALAFAERCAARARRWVPELEAALRDGRRVVLWGSGSKATAFLTTLGVEKGVDAVVDVNPYRQGMCMAGTGQPIVAPDALRASPPDLVIVMNPIYREEIARGLAAMGLRPTIEDL